jgi:hypothetical protein
MYGISRGSCYTCYPRVIYNRQTLRERKDVSECGKIAEGEQNPIWKDRERSVGLLGITVVHHVDEYLWCRGASLSR